MDMRTFMVCRMCSTESQDRHKTHALRQGRMVPTHTPQNHCIQLSPQHSCPVLSILAIPAVSGHHHAAGPPRCRAQLLRCPAAAGSRASGPALHSSACPSRISSSLMKAQTTWPVTSTRCPEPARCVWPKPPTEAFGTPGPAFTCTCWVAAGREGASTARPGVTTAVDTGQQTSGASQGSSCAPYCHEMRHPHPRLTTSACQAVQPPTWASNRKRTATSTQSAYSWCCSAWAAAVAPLPACSLAACARLACRQLTSPSSAQATSTVACRSGTCDNEVGQTDAVPTACHVAPRLQRDCRGDYPPSCSSTTPSRKCAHCCHVGKEARLNHIRLHAKEGCWLTKLGWLSLPLPAGAQGW